MSYMRQNGNFQYEDPFGKSAQGIAFIIHEAMLMMKFLQTKPRIRNKNINYHDLYYCNIENLSSLQK